MRLRATGRGGELAPVLPMPYPQLRNARMRRGQTSLWIAASGVGKSQLLNNIAQRMGEPTLYWSADTDHTDVLLRTIALWSGSTTSEVEQHLHEPSWQQYHERHMQEAAHVDWVFDSQIDAGMVAERFHAYAELHGEFPHLAVVDNLSNTAQDSDDKWSEYERVMAALQRLARNTDCHIAILSHAKGEYEDGTRPIPKKGSLGNVFRTVALGVSLHRANDEGTQIAVHVVKNRGGKDDPAAKHPILLGVDFDRARVNGWQVAA